MQRRSFIKTLAVGTTSITSGCAAIQSAVKPGHWILYVGSYTGEKSKGIEAFRFDAASGAMDPLGLAAEVKNPSFLAIHPNGNYLYAVNETNDWGGKKVGAVTAFRIDHSTSKLTRLNEMSSGGDGPCHLVVDHSGRCVLVANYGGGSVASFKLASDGSLESTASFHQHRGPVHLPQRQGSPHGHSINVSPDNRFAFAADLGLDQILVYRLDAATGELTPHQPPYTKVPPGSGPRHFTFHSGGKFAYVINEITCTVTTFSYQPKLGILTELQTVSTLPEGVAVHPSYSTAEIVAHPTGRFIYGSNRGHDTIAVFKVGKDGRLTLVENVSTQGKTPRNFAIDPTGTFLLAENQSSDSVVAFRIHQGTGRLTATGRVINVGSPVCIRFVKAR